MTRAQQIGVIVGLIIVAALTLLRAYDPLPLRVAREITFDEYQRLAPRAFQQMPVRVVDIDEASLRAFGQWPWPRDRIADLVTRLTDIGASAIAFDIIFAEPDRLSPRSIARSIEGVSADLVEKLRDNDAIFAQAIADRPVVLGFGLSNEGDFRPEVKAGFAFVGESPINAPPHIQAATPILPPLETNATGIGHVSLSPGRPTAVVRAVPLFLSDGNNLYPNLALEALRVAQGASTYVVASANDVPDTITGLKVGEFEMPLTAAGELWLYVTRDNAERYVSAMQVLGPEEPSDAVRSALEGSIVFIGTSASGLQDIRTTALGQNVPGVSLHAQTVEQILSGQFLSRPDWADGLEIITIAVVGTMLVLLTTFVSPATGLVCGLTITALGLVGSWIAFAYAGLLFDPLAPIAFSSMTHFAATSFRFLVIDRERREVRRAFGHYLSPSLLHRIENNRDALKLGGDDRELTIMFVDVRNFTEISERLTPTGLVQFLNKLLDALSRHVIAHEGTLDKYIGDSIMAFWNAPVDVPNHATKAVHAALAMRETMARLNAEDAFGFGGGQKVGIGIGIHTGIACVGNMGAETHFNYSAVGDAVNTTARLESSCKEVGFDIIISDSTAKLLPGYAVLEAGRLPLKGKSTRTKVLVVAGDEEMARTQEFRQLQLAHKQAVHALRTNDPANLKLLKVARRKAEAVSASLAEFYRLLPRRAEHFSTNEPVRAAPVSAPAEQM
jgi:adenylate cyclase